MRSLSPWVRFAALAAVCWLAGSPAWAAEPGVPGVPGSGGGAIPSVQALAASLPCTVDYFPVEGHPAFLIRPKAAAKSPMPWVWYAPAIGNPNPNHAWMLRQWLEAGIGMAGVDVGESFGNLEGRKVFTALWETLRTRYRMSERPCLLPQSRGGLMLYNWAAENPGRVGCIAGIYTVCDLRSYPGLERACGAYGLTAAELARRLMDHNPIDRLGPLAKAKVPIFHIHGDTDKVVPLERNAGELARRYRALGGSVRLVVIPGKGHQVCNEFFQCQELVDFVVAQTKGGLTPEWESGNTAELPGLRVTLSKPVLVGRSKGYLWFPTVVRVSSGDIVAMMSDYADAHVAQSTAQVAWSSDGGRTWSPMSKALGGDGSLALPGGDQLIMPYYLRPAANGAMTGVCQIWRTSRRTLEVVKPGVSVEGWPRPDKSFSPQLGLSGFVCNGQVVSLAGGRYLGTLYGYFRDTARYSLVASESSDGLHWKIRSVIADEKCDLPGREGPCESALVRLKDGRLMCIFRLDSGVPYGQTFSSDEGRTWTRPAAMQGVFSVQPSLAVLPDRLVALSGGRPGLFLWLNPDGTAATWHKLDVLANHNAHRPEEPIQGAGNTSSYTEVISVDDSHLLCIYDRIPFGWNPIPASSSDTNSVWVVRATLRPLSTVPDGTPRKRN